MNSRVWIKICGLTTEAAVDAAIRAQVDAIGFVFAPSKRRVTAQHATELCKNVPKTIARVAVFQHPTQAELNEVCELLQPDYVQTDVEDLAELHIPESIRVNPVLRSGRSLPNPLPARVVFEGPVSGTGKTIDWTEAARVARRTKLVLAGGLNPENVAEATRIVNPFGVDVSSGVESSPGIKDPALILRFVSAVREAQDVLVV